MIGRTAAVCLALAALAAAVVTLPSSASQLVTRDPKTPVLQVDANGYALVTYAERGARKSVLFWGAVNALPPAQGAKQVEFKVDYSGGWKALKKPNYWKTIRNVCKPYKPPLPWLVAACRAPDGSSWAIQSWQKMLPNLGVAPWKPEQAAQELHLSHWKGPLPVLDVHLDWVYGGRYEHLFGTYAYQGKGVYGFRVTGSGVPLDSWGRNVYLDTLDSAYGPGWKRENSFVAQGPNGLFCYAFFEHDPYAGYPAVGKRPPGVGKQYRITAMGPGVLPVVTWQGNALGAYDANDPAKTSLEGRMNQLQDQIAAGSGSCKQH